MEPEELGREEPQYTARVVWQRDGWRLVEQLEPFRTYAGIGLGYYWKQRLLVERLADRDTLGNECWQLSDYLPTHPALLQLLQHFGAVAVVDNEGQLARAADAAG